MTQDLFAKIALAFLDPSDRHYVYSAYGTSFKQEAFHSLLRLMAQLESLMQAGLLLQSEIESKPRVIPFRKANFEWQKR